MQYLRVDKNGELAASGTDAGGRIHWMPASVAPRRTMVKCSPTAIVIKTAGHGTPARRNFVPASYEPAVYAVYRILDQRPDGDTRVYTVELVIDFPTKS